MAKYFLVIGLALMAVACGGGSDKPVDSGETIVDKYGECLQVCVNDSDQNPADCNEVCAHAIPADEK